MLKMPTFSRLILFIRFIYFDLMVEDAKPGQTKVLIFWTIFIKIKLADTYM